MTVSKFLHLLKAGAKARKGSIPQTAPCSGQPGRGPAPHTLSKVTLSGQSTLLVSFNIGDHRPGSTTQPSLAPSKCEYPGQLSEDHPKIIQ